MNLTVSDIQRFCMHDGPGIRTVFFLKGCPLRCAWCHNPETQRLHPELLFYQKKCIGCGACQAVCPAGAHRLEADGHEIDRDACRMCGRCEAVCPTGALSVCGKPYDTAALLAEAEKDRAFYGASGGITLSGGEPLLQPQGCLELLRRCRDAGIGTAIETCGMFDPAILPALVPLVDLFLWDIKDTDSRRHKQYTGAGNETILSNLRAADALGAQIRLRCILVNGVNTDDAHYAALHALRDSLHGCVGLDLLPYHAYGGAKAVFLGQPDNGVPSWIPSGEQIDEARRLCGAD
ncbi:MAG: glycyl-radical enzyme activating protein [Clostridiales bacterium]|nr:glycyl-radical enzyme activating protein [Clostridiales bacterium]MDD7310699.1 glycyl-radical enzyme activating protein [Eubacteriales bacterium]MDY5347317.1 glycyl-radical enzyme activating protein [Eubacteriales bacterium]